MAREFSLSAIVEPQVNERAVEREASNTRQSFEEELSDLEVSTGTGGVAGAGAAPTGGGSAVGTATNAAAGARVGSSVAGAGRGAAAAGGGVLAGAGALGTVAIGGAVGLGILSAVERVADSSAAFRAEQAKASQALSLFARPFGRFLATRIEPLTTGLLDLAVEFNKVANDENSLSVALMEVADNVELIEFDNALIDGEISLGDVFDNFPSNIRQTVIEKIAKGLSDGFDAIENAWPGWGNIVDRITNTWPGWNDLIDSVSLASFVTPVGLPAFVTGVTLSNFVTDVDLSSDSFVEGVDLSSDSFVEGVDLSSDSFVTGVDLRDSVTDVNLTEFVTGVNVGDELDPLFSDIQDGWDGWPEIPEPDIDISASFDANVTGTIQDFVEGNIDYEPIVEEVTSRLDPRDDSSSGNDGSSGGGSSGGGSSDDDDDDRSDSQDDTSSDEPDRSERGSNRGSRDDPRDDTSSDEPDRSERGSNRRGGRGNVSVTTQSTRTTQTDRLLRELRRELREMKNDDTVAEELRQLRQALDTDSGQRSVREKDVVAALQRLFDRQGASL